MYFLSKVEVFELDSLQAHFIGVAADDHNSPRRLFDPVDANGLPIALKITPGQAHDGRSAEDMLDGMDDGQILLADRAYDSDRLRETLQERGAWANIKPMQHRVNVPAFSPYLYKQRNRVERFFNKLKHFRAIATRFEKYAENYLGLIKLAAIRIWLRVYESVT